jgi:glycosyltransferase involved in cell wall biosynthesis
VKARGGAASLIRCALTERPQIVCVTPVKNEAWILERFLEGVSLWADHIVVGDQGSTDGSAAIAARFPRVTVVENRQEAYDEGARQRLLLDAARTLPGPRLIVALDADEALSANWAESREWQDLLAAPPGTVARFDWVNLLPGLSRCWIPHEKRVFAFMDDGAPHGGTTMHSERLPVRPGAPEIAMEDVRVLHLQHADPARMRSKQRWYQCLEAVNDPAKRPIQLYRQYHWMDALPGDEIHPTDAEWLARYRECGIELLPAPNGDCFWWDEEVLEWMKQHGPDRFRRLDVWDVDLAPSDPRTRFDRAVHRWLERTQPNAGRRSVRWAQRLLIPFGW